MTERKEIVNYRAMGKRLQAVRKKKKLTQTDISVLVGVSAGLIGHIERGIKRPSLDTLAAICRALNVDMHYIVFGEFDNMPKNITEQIEDLIEVLSAYVRK